MKKNVNTFLRAIIALSLMWSMGLATHAHDFEVDGIYYNILTDSTVAVTYQGDNDYLTEYTGVVDIPSFVTNDGITYSVTSIGKNAFSSCDDLTKVIIPNSVTVIDDYAFYHCENMENLVIPDFVSKIGIYAFHYCQKITEITIPNLVTDIGDFAFDNCSNLAIVNYNAENCIGARGEKVFNGCFAFKTLNIGDKVTIIPARGFADCKKLTELKIGNSVTKIGNSAFENCLGLTEVVIPDSVIEIGNYAFAGCDSVTNIKIGNSVTDIGAEAFFGCRLTELVIPKSVYRIGNMAFSSEYLSSILVEDGNQRFDSRDNCNAIILTSGNELKVGCKNTIIPNTVNEIGSYAFAHCKTLKEIEIPNSITRIGNYAFLCCERLSVVTIPNSVTRIDDCAFSECYFLTTIEFNAENCSYMGSPNNPCFYGCLVENISIGNSVKNIPKAAFCDLKYLKKIVIPNSVTKIGKEAFAGCIRLDTIIVEDGNATYDSRGNSNVIIETATNTLIAGCNRSVIPNSVQRIEDYAFWGYSDLTDITIPSSVTYIGRDVFKNTGWYEKQPDGLLYLDNCCLGRKEYALVGDVCLDPNTRLIAGGAFEGCRGITSVKMGNSVVSIGSNAFDSCEKLTEIDMPNSVKEIGTYAFYNCASLTSITIPDSVKIIGDYAFYRNGLEVVYYNVKEYKCVYDVNDYYSWPKPMFVECNSLKVINIGDSVKTIPHHMLRDCCSITDVKIGKSVATIGDYAFRNCTGITEISIPNTVVSMGQGAFNNCKGLTKLHISDISAWCDINFIEPYSNPLYFAKTLMINDTIVENLIIPNNVTNIKQYAFRGCTSLTEITFHEYVSEIGGSAFDGCTGLQKVVSLNPTPPACNGYCFSLENSTCQLEVPCGAKEKYSTANEWKRFMNIIEIATVDVIPKQNSAIFQIPTINDAHTYTVNVYSDKLMTQLVKTENYDATGSIIPMSTTIEISVNGLDKGVYYYQIIVKSISGEELNNYNGNFKIESTTNVDNTLSEKSSIEVARYDIHGRLLSVPSKGINIVKYSDGTTRKECVR